LTVSISSAGSRSVLTTSGYQWRSRALRSAARNKAYFVGGIASDYATRRRIEGFTDAVKSMTGRLDPDQVDAHGYDADIAEEAVRRLHARLRGLPRALFVNSTIALEGVVRFLTRLPREELDRCVFGCYDWDPFAAMLTFPLLMVRQDVEALLGEAFRIIDSGTPREVRVIEIKPRLLFG